MVEENLHVSKPRARKLIPENKGIMGPGKNLIVPRFAPFAFSDGRQIHPEMACHIGECFVESGKVTAGLPLQLAVPHKLMQKKSWE